jgi:hypothetical protein
MKSRPTCAVTCPLWPPQVAAFWASPSSPARSSAFTVDTVWLKQLYVLFLIELASHRVLLAAELAGRGWASSTTLSVAAWRASEGPDPMRGAARSRPAVRRRRGCTRAAVRPAWSSPLLERHDRRSGGRQSVTEGRGCAGAEPGCCARRTPSEEHGRRLIVAGLGGSPLSSDGLSAPPQAAGWSLRTTCTRSRKRWFSSGSVTGSPIAYTIGAQATL